MMNYRNQNSSLCLKDKLIIILLQINNLTKAYIKMQQPNLKFLNNPEKKFMLINQEIVAKMPKIFIIELL